MHLKIHAVKNTQKMKEKTLKGKNYFPIFPKSKDCISQLPNILRQIYFDLGILRFQSTVAWPHYFGPGAEHRGEEDMVEQTSSPPRGQEGREGKWGHTSEGCVYNTVTSFVRLHLLKALPSLTNTVS